MLTWHGGRRGGQVLLGGGLQQARQAHGQRRGCACPEAAAVFCGRRQPLALGHAE